MREGWRRLRALMKKEALQIVRDPSALVITFVLPVVLLFLFAYAVSLDIRKVKIGLVVTSEGPAAQSLVLAFMATPYFSVDVKRHQSELVGGMRSGQIRGYVLIPEDFDSRVTSRSAGSWLQIVTDGSQPNTAGFVASYAQGVVARWMVDRGLAVSTPVEVRSRIWFNPEVESRRFLLPGAIAIIMTMIGTLLTALVVAREWERGTIEALLSTPARVVEILLGKLLPYFGLGMAAGGIAAVLATTLFGIPLEGSWWALLLLQAAFLVPALGQGLVISAIAKNQFIASQVALFTGFLPAFLLSGFLFEIDSMPLAIRAVSTVVAARYFVGSLQTVFLVGDVWALFLPNIAAMLAIGTFFFVLARLKTRRSLE